MPKDDKSEDQVNHLFWKREESQTFWKHWQKEYLDELRNFAINKANRTEFLKESTFVLIEDKQRPRQAWVMARYLHNEWDEKVRSCFLQLLGRAEVNHPVQTLYPLEVE
ncbi:hypothetical protein MRX96_022034 [Rhipicephalus microplus]